MTSLHKAGLRVFDLLRQTSWTMSRTQARFYPPISNNNNSNTQLYFCSHYYHQRPKSLSSCLGPALVTLEFIHNNRHIMTAFYPRPEYNITAHTAVSDFKRHKTFMAHTSTQVEIKSSHSPRRTFMSSPCMFLSSTTQTYQVDVIPQSSAASQPLQNITKTSKTISPIKDDHLKSALSKSNPPSPSQILTHFKFENQEFLDPTMKASIIHRMGHSHLTYVQSQSLPITLARKNCLVKAKTGTGKTLAFLIPLVTRILEQDHDTPNLGYRSTKSRHKHVIAPPEKIYSLIIAPTRELAVQIANEAKLLTKSYPGFNVACIYGGRDVVKDRTVELNHKEIHILVATPGRLNDHLENWKKFSPALKNYVRVLVMDECDSLLEMGFKNELEYLLNHLPAMDRRQTMLFSATLPMNVKKLIVEVCPRDFVLVDAKIQDKDKQLTHSHVRQEIVVAPPHQQIRVLVEILDSIQAQVDAQYLNLKNQTTTLPLPRCNQADKAMTPVTTSSTASFTQSLQDGPNAPVFAHESKVSDVEKAETTTANSSSSDSQQVDSIAHIADEKTEASENVVHSLVSDDGPVFKVMVFLPTAQLTKFMAKFFKALNRYDNILSIHSEKSQLKRQAASQQFLRKKRVVMFTSDVSARGMDYPDVTAVIQIGITEAAQYVHRLGRTARVGKPGMGILLIAPFEKEYMSEILPKKKYNLIDMNHKYVDPIFHSDNTQEATLVNKDYPQDVDHQIRDLLSRVKEVPELKSAAEQSYRSFLGFFRNYQKRLHWDSNNLTAHAKTLAEALGLDYVPPIDAYMGKRLELKGNQGVKILESNRERDPLGLEKRKKRTPTFQMEE